MAPSKRNCLTLEQKIKIIDEMAGGKRSIDVCRSYNLSSSTVRTIWKTKDKIKGTEIFNSSKKRMRKPVNTALDQALLVWLKEKKSWNLPVSGHILLEKAQEFSKLLSPNNNRFVCTKSWIDRFQNRYQICSSTANAEVACVLEETASYSNWLEIRKDYSDNDIFNGDEFGLFYKILPNQSLQFRQEKCHGGKNSNERFTVFACANMTGTEKRELLVIGNEKLPNLKIHKLNYTVNENAWITPDIFEEEIRNWDTDLQKQNRKIILMINNGPAHPVIKNLVCIKLVFLQPTVNLPMGQGIMACLKEHYKKIFLGEMTGSLDDGKEFKFSLSDGILALNTAWERVSQKTIVNSYRLAGFYQGNEQGLGQSFKTENLGIIEDNDTLCLHDWVIWKNLMNKYFNTDDLNTYQDIDNDLSTCEYPSEVDIAESVKSLQIKEESEVCQPITSHQIPINFETPEDKEEDEVLDPLAIYQTKEELEIPQIKKENEDVEFPTVYQVAKALETIDTYLKYNDLDADVKSKFHFVQTTVKQSFLNQTDV